ERERPRISRPLPRPVPTPRWPPRTSSPLATAAWCAAGVWAAVARIAAFLVDGAIAGDERIERWAVGASPRVRDRLFRARAALHAAGRAAKAWVVRTWPLFVARLAAWTSALGRHLRRAAVAAGAWLVTHRLALR